MKKLALTAAVAALIVTSSVTAGLVSSSGAFQRDGVTTWHFAYAPHTQFVALRQVGVSPLAATPDDTRLVEFVDGLNQTQKTHSAHWKFIRLPSSVPAKAKVVRLSFRTAITRGHSAGAAVIYAFVRTPGTATPPGPPGFTQYPVDFSLKGQALDGSDNARPPMVIQADATGYSGSYRNWSSIDLPVRHHGFGFAWGYRRVMGTWPIGDAIGIAIYVDGWAN